MTAPLRVVLSHPTAWPQVHRGAERYVHELSSALVRVGHDVTVLTTGPEPGRTEVLGVPVVAFPAGRPEVFGLRCAAWVARRRPDVWHANGLFDAAAAAALPGVRSVVTSHGPVEQRSLNGRRRRAAFAVARRADAWVCVSPAAADQARSAWGLSATVIPPGVDTQAFTPGGERAADPVVLYVGTMSSPRKNLALLLEGAAQALESHPRLEVWLAGEGEPPTPPAALAPRVRRLGLLSGPGLLDAYRRAWVTALISEREVFGMAVVESLSCGTPALVLDDGWGPSGIVDEGTGVRTGASPEAVALGIASALELARADRVVTRCQEAAAQYDWHSRVTPRVEEVYRGS